jgi:hypothetical protein
MAIRSCAALGMVLAGAVAGCGSSTSTAPLEAPDSPVPPDEPRAELQLVVDLPPAQDCEESFDLALYQDRGIELIQWDDRSGFCEGRTIAIRYLSRKLSAQQVRAAARAHASRVRPARAPSTPPPTRAPSPPPGAPPEPKQPTP